MHIFSECIVQRVPCRLFMHTHQYSSSIFGVKVIVFARFGRKMIDLVYRLVWFVDALNRCRSVFLSTLSEAILNNFKNFVILEWQVANWVDWSIPFSEWIESLWIWIAEVLSFWDRMKHMVGNFLITFQISIFYLPFSFSLKLRLIYGNLVNWSHQKNDKV